jgi:hypothetical protein
VIARAASEAIQQAVGMHRLAQNIYQLHGPFLAFKAGQVHTAFRTIAERTQATRRPREQGPWAAREAVKFQAFCRGIRILVRQGRLPPTLAEALGLDAAGMAAAAEALRQAQSSPSKAVAEPGALLDRQICAGKNTPRRDMGRAPGM